MTSLKKQFSNTKELNNFDNNHKELLYDDGIFFHWPKSEYIALLIYKPSCENYFYFFNITSLFYNRSIPRACVQLLCSNM
jgi:hypothetical protein